MPLQCGPLFITGTLDDVCFYKMEGKYYVRQKSSLTRKRVLRDPKFQLTRVYAALLGEASKIASHVYRLIAGEQKKHALYREMTGKAIYMLREGKDAHEVYEILCRQYLQPKKEAVAGISGKKVTHHSTSRKVADMAMLCLAEIPFRRLQSGRKRRMCSAVIHRKESTQGP